MADDEFPFRDPRPVAHEWTLERIALCRDFVRGMSSPAFATCVSRSFLTPLARHLASSDEFLADHATQIPTWNLWHVDFYPSLDHVSDLLAHFAGSTLSGVMSMGLCKDCTVYVAMVCTLLLGQRKSHQAAPESRWSVEEPLGLPMQTSAGIDLSRCWVFFCARLLDGILDKWLKGPVLTSLGPGNVAWLSHVFSTERVALQGLLGVSSDALRRLDEGDQRDLIVAVRWSLVVIAQRLSLLVTKLVDSRVLVPGAELAFRQWVLTIRDPPAGWMEKMQAFRLGPVDAPDFFISLFPPPPHWA